jgi:hypothetical protein
MFPAAEQATYVRERWNNRVLKAEVVAKKNKQRYYVLRIGFISLATLAPPVVTAQAATRGSFQTFLGVTAIAFSLLVAISAGLLEITKPGQRWRLYQRLRYDLEGVGWELAESRKDSAEWAEESRFQHFVDHTELLLRRHADDYFSEIAQIASVDRESQHGGPPHQQLQRSGGQTLGHATNDHARTTASPLPEFGQGHAQ